MAKKLNALQEVQGLVNKLRQQTGGAIAGGIKNAVNFVNTAPGAVGMAGSKYVIQPTMQNVAQGAKAAVRQYAYSNPVVNMNPTLRKQYGVDSGYNLKQSLQDTGSFLKGVGSVADPAGNIIGGGIGTAFNAASNLYNKKPIFQNADKAYRQGFDFSATLGPIGKAVGSLPLNRIAPAVERFVPKVGQMTGRIAEGATKEFVKGAGYGAVTGENPITTGLGFAPFGALEAFKPAQGVRVKGTAVYKDDVQHVKEAIDYLSSKGYGKKPQLDVLKQLEKDAEVFKSKLKLVDRFEGGRDIKAWKGMSLEDKYKMIANKLEDSFYTPKGQGGSGMQMSLIDNKLRKNVPKGSYTNDPSIDNPLLNKKGTPQTPGEVIGSTDNYIQDLVGRQKQAKGPAGPKSIVQKSKSFLSEVKEKMVDSNAPIEDALSTAEKQGRFKVLPKQDIRLQIDKVLRSKSMASQFAQDNGMVDVIQKAPDLDYLNQYMIAKQATDVSARGVETGRDLVKDRQLIKDLGATYEPLAKQVNDYSRKLLQYSVDSGLIDKKMANDLIKKYPNYVPINRIFSELEQGTMPKVGTRAVASLSKQSVVQKLKGSEREISNPIESILLKTQDAFNQGERNKAAQMLAKYRSLPGMKDLIRELPEGSRSNNTFSYLENGVKKTFETTPEIAAAAKSLNQEQMGLVAKVISVPTRVLQVGATGLNLPFVVTNVAKDQITGFINSNKAAKTSLMNPLNFLKAVTSAIEHNDLYDEMVRNAGGGTSFDIARQAPELSVARIRAGKNIQSQIKYTVTHPGELLRAVENIIGRGEEVARIQNYKGTKDALLQSGRTAQDATLLGAQAARENTANFARKGSWGKALNWMVPFFNAGIQGARQLDRSFQKDPKGTATKMAVGLFMPMTAATVWNMSDPTRKAAYDDIQDYEKENNMIIIPPNPTKDEKGRWNIIKIPIPPGLSNLTSLVRRPLEQTYGGNAVKLQEIATNLFAAGTSIDLASPRKLGVSFVPQAVKPIVESTTNTNLFTGNKIVPDSMKDLPPNMQVRDTTAPGAKAIGNALNVSPLMVENAAQTIGGGLGAQLIGKEDPMGNLQRRFTKGAGGKKESEEFDQIQQYRQQDAVNRVTKNQAVESLGATLNELPKEQKKAYLINGLKSGQIDKETVKKYLDSVIEQKMGKSKSDDFLSNSSVNTRASVITDRIRSKPKAEQKALLIEYARKKILTEAVLQQVLQQIKQ